MRCRDCARYDLEAQKCLDSKVNPFRWDQAVDVANLLGVRAICVFNPFREKLLASRCVPGGLGSRPRQVR